MKNQEKKVGMTGVWAFLIVLFSMPLGHALMIACEHTFGENGIFTVAFFMGFAGLLLTLWGFLSKGDTKQTLLGFLGGLLFWTGWIEFAFVYFARRYGVEPLIENGEVVTKPEYLIMPSSVGFWAMMMIGYLLNSRTGCNLFNWIQRHVLRTEQIRSFTPVVRNVAVSTFMELNTVLWTCYLLLLFVYDNAFLGDRHPVAYVVAFASLVWALYLFTRLIRYKHIGPAIRYAIPTVIIFWNFVEILGRWGIFKEIWVHPFEYVLEMILMLSSFIVLIGFLYFSDHRAKEH
ncbi:hypothetical protein [Porphyromonas gulae]|uniref:hypothetical protein n=1 Tax=Porphyromonas gulae TaxID=111105 RepID=UPI0026E95053|nr:hypothetical protein [Porphyromonas gulae]